MSKLTLISLFVQGAITERMFRKLMRKIKE